MNFTAGGTGNIIHKQIVLAGLRVKSGGNNLYWIIFPVSLHSLNLIDISNLRNKILTKKADTKIALKE
jgi:hypothetical protein